MSTDITVNIDDYDDPDALNDGGYKLRYDANENTLDLWDDPYAGNETYRAALPDHLSSFPIGLDPSGQVDATKLRAYVEEHADEIVRYFEIAKSGSAEERVEASATLKRLLNQEIPV